MTSRTRPVEKLARATAQCSTEVSICYYVVARRQTDLAQAAAYGKCIVGDYTAVHKDMCAKEFMRLKDCYLVCWLAAVEDAFG